MTQMQMGDDYLRQTNNERKDMSRESHIEFDRNYCTNYAPKRLCIMDGIKLTPEDIHHFLTAPESDPRFREIAQRVNIAICEWRGAKIIKKRFTYGSKRGYKWAWDGNEETPCAFPGSGFYGFGWNEEASINELPNHILGKSALYHCEQAEVRMTDEQLKIYEMQLQRMKALSDDDSYWMPMRKAETYLWHASPRHRSLALLRVVRPEFFA